MKPIRRRMMEQLEEPQETVGVSPQQFEEFVFTYQKPLIERLGACAYGCCEALEDRFGILKRNLPNLRWVAVSPWADAGKLADEIAGDYVYLYKVNPAFVVAEDPDWDAAAEQIRTVQKLTKGMSVPYSLKDTNTFCGEPERISRWVEMTRSVVSGKTPARTRAALLPRKSEYRRSFESGAPKERGRPILGTASD